MSGRFPSHLHRPLPPGSQMFKTNSILKKYRLNTVCEEAKCPNRLECYTHRTATFLALGKACTRNCGFCDIDFTKNPQPPEADEPDRIAHSVRELGLSHAVITMVARDDLPNGGAEHIASIVRAIRRENLRTTVEVLTSDFGGDFRALDLVLAERPDIFNHNLETVRSLTPRVRHRAEYDRSLSILRYAKESGRTGYVKSGIMLGFGETDEEVLETLRDLAKAACDIITIGQYLQPSRMKLRVKEFIPLERFQAYEKEGAALGVKHMYCGPFVRSDYNANLFVPAC
jgi:lipoyl synthase